MSSVPSRPGARRDGERALEGAAPGRPLEHLDHSYPTGYTPVVIEVRQTKTFARWFKGAPGHAGARPNLGPHPTSLPRQPWRRPGSRRRGFRDACPWGPGYRIYFVARGEAVVVLLAGGDKRTQTTDIQEAMELARTL